LSEIPYPAKAALGTIRGDFSIETPFLANIEARPMYNMIHASENPEEAKNEIALWFTEGWNYCAIKTIDFVDKKDIIQHWLFLIGLYYVYMAVEQKAKKKLQYHTGVEVTDFDGNTFVS
jgi:hypothetical protein